MSAAPFCLIASFDIVPAHRAEFVERVRRNAEQSVAGEPGCRRFDVLVPWDDGPVLLYEIYADRAAFDAHLASAHFVRFNRDTSDIVVAKAVSEFTLFEHVKAR